MWRRDVGDWQERRRSRVPESPQVSVPASTVGTGRLGFIPRGFQDEAPTVVRPAATLNEDADATAVAQWRHDEHTTDTSGETWVTLAGVDGDAILDVREYLDSIIGLTTAHYVPPTCGGGGGGIVSGPREVYLEFQSPIAAARAVQACMFRVDVEPGAAFTTRIMTAKARGVPPGDGVGRDSYSGYDRKREAGADWAGNFTGAGGGGDRGGGSAKVADNCSNVYMTNVFSIEFIVSWCTDAAFLAERRERRKRRRARLQPFSSSRVAMDSEQVALYNSRKAREAACVDRSGEVDESPSRRSGTIAAAAANGNETEVERDNNGHPSLPRRGRRTHPREVAKTDYASSASQCAVEQSTSALRDSTTFPLQAWEAGGFTAVTSPSSPIGNGSNASVLSLFFASTGRDNIWCDCLRLAVTLVWTVLRFLSGLIGVSPLPSISATPRRDGATAAASAAVEESSSGMQQASTSGVGAQVEHVVRRSSALDGHGSSITSRWRHRRRQQRQQTKKEDWWTSILPLYSFSFIGMAADSSLYSSSSSCSCCYSSSPVAAITAALASLCPFTPDAQEVDQLLWSWLSVRTPYPQRSARLLKAALLRQRSYTSGGSDSGEGYYRSSHSLAEQSLGIGSDLVSFADSLWTGGTGEARRYEDTDGDRNRNHRGGRSGSQHQRRSGRGSMQGSSENDEAGTAGYDAWAGGSPVLLAWRPGWWFTRYSVISALVFVWCVVCRVLFV